LDELAAGFGFAVGDYFDDVEAEGDLGIVEQAQPGERAARDLSLLKRLNVVNRTAQIFVRSCFYFNEHERVAIAADDIDLAGGPVFEIPIKNLVTLFAKKTAGSFFTGCSADLFRCFR
jgi:hypothetical protein